MPPLALTSLKYATASIVAMTLKFTVHVVQSFMKGHRKSGVISIKHSRDITNQNNLTHLQWNNVCV